MRQRRWFELVKDYEILSHPSKTNVVVDALSRKVSHSAALIIRRVTLHQDLERAEIAESRRLSKTWQADKFSISSNDGLLFERGLCVPTNSAVKTDLLTKVHSFSFSMHPGLPKTLKGYTMVWVIIDRLTLAHFIPGKSTYTTRLQAAMGTSLHRLWKMLQSLICWDEVGEQRLMGPKLVQSTNEAIQKIRGHKMFLKVAPMKGVMRFERKEKLSPCFVGPFEIL
ncbi:pol protein [Cucumis melo var. makuwa]|uniref:Pol protein n=1 Tax=Cucumis melo var. makuwa TaxID=1194695 RepID=A0A5A7UR88_CUCMM|nr:pol protein [Cucumis melo var. makuwa]